MQLITQGIIDSITEPASVDETKQLLRNCMEMQTDLALVKNNMIKAAEAIGLLDENGNLKENISMKKLIGLMMNQDKLQSQLGFITQLAPLLEKYKHL